MHAPMPSTTTSGAASPRLRRFRLLLVLAVAAAASARADVVVPAGATWSLGNGALDLGCTDLNVAGTLAVDDGAAVHARHVTIAPGGSTTVASGNIALGGTFANHGHFAPGSGSVTIGDEPCAAAGGLSGATTFHDLVLASGTGKTVVLESDRAQSVLHRLVVRGNAGAPLAIVASKPGAQAYTHLAAGGTQDIAHVAVTDNWATGQPLARNLSNEGGGGNVRNWFGIVLEVPVPSLGLAALALLALLLGGIAMRRLARAGSRLP
jgi:hypothetical protein